MRDDDWSKPEVASGCGQVKPTTSMDTVAARWGWDWQEGLLDKNAAPPPLHKSKRLDVDTTSVRDHQASDGQRPDIALTRSVQSDSIVDNWLDDGGATEEARRKKKWMDETRVCAALIRSAAWEYDPSCSARDLYLCYAAALDGLGRRLQSIRLLECAIDEDGLQDAAVELALAKLLFKARKKREARARCHRVYQLFNAGACSEDIAADAYHLAGWSNIHADDHTGAYYEWSKGANILPDSRILSKQHNKRLCWDALLDPCCDTTGLVGATPVVNAGHVVPYRVHETQLERTPALALFSPNHQNGNLVFKSQHPVLTVSECATVLDHVNTYINESLHGAWGTVRKSSVKTTDVAVEDIRPLRPWLIKLLHTRLYPMLAAAYPVLADGSTTIDSTTGLSRMRVHDAFIVRYDAQSDGSVSLPEHSDTSAMSFTVALNSCGTDFTGGGTWFEALGPRGRVVDADIGHAVAFAGPLRHAGFPITSGTRIILVLFLYIEGFPYGQYLTNYIDKYRCKQKRKSEAENEVSPASKVRPSGDTDGGYVVYNQTVELVAMLDQEVKSVLD